MSIFKKVFIRASHMPAFHIGLLLFIMGLATIKSVALTFLDISAVQLFLTLTTHRTIGIDLIAVSVMMAFTGYETRFLSRRKGYGAVWITGFLLLILMLLIGMIEYRVIGRYDALFIAKYGFFILINAVFWSVCARFFKLTTNSLKFIFVLACEAIGYGVAGAFVYFVNIGAYGLLYFAMALLVAFFAGIYILTQMKPVPKEMFTFKSGEAQDFAERKMVRTLLMFCFFAMTGFAVANYVFYTETAQLFQGKGILRQIASFWGLFGLAEFVLALSLIRRRFFYALSGNMFVMAVSLSALSIGIFYDSYHWIYGGFFVFMITLYMNYNGFAETLLRTLRIGGEQSINKKRLIVIEPTGFMLGAILVYYLPVLSHEKYTLIALTLILILLLIMALHFYANALLHSLKLREWRGTPLMMVSKKIFNYIKNEIPQATTNDIIYFLRILEISKHPFYMKTVLKLLKHPSEKVRLYALEKVGSESDLTRFDSTMRFIFETDESVLVRRQVLALLIQIADLNEDEALLDSYTAFLDNPSLKSGAMIGFLKVGGYYALLAMDGLQKLATGSKTSDKMLALEVMENAPSVGLIRLLIPLLKSTDIQIVNKALCVAGEVKHAECLPLILSSLDDMRLEENALVALKNFGIKAYPLIERTLHNTETSAFRQKVLILFLTMQEDSESKQILLRALKMGNQKLRKAIIRGMIETGIFWKHKGKYQLLKEGILSDADRIFKLSAFCEKYKQAPVPKAQDAFAFLLRSLSEDIEETRELVFYQLLLLNKSNLFQKAVHVLISDDYTAYPTALGVLQDLLRKDLFETVKQIAYLPYEHKKEVIMPQVTIEEAVNELSALLQNPPFHLAGWIRTNLLYCLQKIGDTRGLPAVCKELKSRNPLVAEAAVEALYRLETNSERLNEILLTLPTSVLVAIKPETLSKN